MANSLFREKAVDKVRSPEQLNEYLKIGGPAVWIMLGGLLSVFIAFFVWGIAGTLLETDTFTGVAFSVDDEPLALHAYLPINETKQLAEGMEVRVSPDYAPQEHYGYLIGSVKTIGDAPVSVDSLKQTLGDNFDLLDLPSGNLIEVVVELETNDDGSYRWSTEQGASINVTPGSTCHATAVLAERRPIDLLFSDLQEAEG